MIETTKKFARAASRATRFLWRSPPRTYWTAYVVWSVVEISWKNFARLSDDYAALSDCEYDWEFRRKNAHACRVLEREDRGGFWIDFGNDFFSDFNKKTFTVSNVVSLVLTVIASRIPKYLASIGA